MGVRRLVHLAVCAVLAGLSCQRRPPAESSGFVGSASCRSCHERFYELWAPSHHGLAMQPYTEEFARRELTPPGGAIPVGRFRYRADISGARGWLIAQGPDGEKRYPFDHVLGGKNVYYFLTSHTGGRLQTLPLAYDARRQVWFDTAASGVRHFPDIEDAPLHWTDRAYTFNTSCYGCHVSQLSVNYDLASDSYRTAWAEPGINCETCHGPAGEHVRYCEASEEACRGDPRIIRTSVFTHEQMNSTCAPCHAKMAAISTDFRPGDRYFDHYDLVTLEHRDFYPDGRDLGENYTFTTWRLSPCAKSGQLDCVHCHTSSGRYRFGGEQANEACAPCHFDKVKNPAPHTRHPAGTAAGECVSCHMPKTEFARMIRSDHSMRPPAPAATLEFQSPNACNLCHTDRDAVWADRVVRQWRDRDYQAPILRAGRLVDAARKQDWSRLGDIVDYIRAPDRDEVFATSLVRLLHGCPDERKWSGVFAAAADPSPLVRAAAAESLGGNRTPEAIAALVKAAHDDFRLVRIRAAASLAGAPLHGLPPGERRAVEAATEEFLASLRTRPDDDSGHTNRGNYLLNTGDLQGAIAAFETATRLNPRNVAALVNLALALNLDGQNEKAERRLRRALDAEPRNSAAWFNYGLLLGEMGRRDEAREALRQALQTDAANAAAAFNLCVLESDHDLSQAIGYCREAARLRPEEPRYAYTLGFYLARSGRLREAVQVLEGVVARHPTYGDAYGLLMSVYETQGDREAAASLARRARQLGAAPR